MRRLSVRALHREVQELLAARYTTILVEGEVGDLTAPPNGHRYLTLRDHDAVLSCVVWRNHWINLKYQPKIGDRVQCRGGLAVYARRGTYQLYVNDILPAGAGRLAAEIEARRQRLLGEGLLDPRRKRVLPGHPRFVGVATSLGSAALADFLQVSRRRFPAARVLVAGCAVQGREAAASVVRAVDLLLEDGRADVIVITRGGGGKEDLLPFQDEQLARFAAHCPVPVISAVGHQVDTTLLDLVADAVAATPSEAAVLALPDGKALLQSVDEARTALHAAMRRHIERDRLRVQALRRQLRHPGERVRQQRVRLLELRRRLDASIDGVLVARRRRLEGAAAELRALSPVSVLERGYAIVHGPHGLVRSTADVATGDAISIRVGDGTLPAVVD